MLDCNLFCVTVQIQSAGEEFEEVIAKIADVLLSYGISKLTWSFSEKALLINMICENIVIHKCKAALDQFSEGLQCNELLHANLVEKPFVFKPLFTDQPPAFGVKELRQLYSIGGFQYDVIVYKYPRSTLGCF